MYNFNHQTFFLFIYPILVFIGDICCYGLPMPRLSANFPIILTLLKSLLDIP